MPTCALTRAGPKSWLLLIEMRVRGLQRHMRRIVEFSLHENGAGFEHPVVGGAKIQIGVERTPMRLSSSVSANSCHQSASGDCVTKPPDLAFCTTAGGNRRRMIVRANCAGGQQERSRVRLQTCFSYQDSLPWFINLFHR